RDAEGRHARLGGGSRPLATTGREAPGLCRGHRARVPQGRWSRAAASVVSPATHRKASIMNPEEILPRELRTPTDPDRRHYATRRPAAIDRETGRERPRSLGAPAPRRRLDLRRRAERSPEEAPVPDPV